MPSPLLVKKELAVPGTVTPNTIYLITDSNGAFLEMYVSDNTGTTTRRLPSRTDIEGWINSAVAGIGTGTGVIVPDITARNALAPTTVTIAYVLDASADATVDTGGATYIFNPTGSTWTKIAEFESMDVTTSWASISGKPNSSPAAIDNAVNVAHSHANMTQLNKISESAGGELLFNGEHPLSRISTANW